MVFDKRQLREWKEGIYQHLVSQSFGCYVLVQRMPAEATETDVASFFRNFHLQGHGVTMLHDVSVDFLRPLLLSCPIHMSHDRV